MSRRLLTLALFGAVTLSVRVSNAQISQQGKTAAVTRAIDDLWARAVDGLKNGDAVALSALYTDDGMIIGPDAPTASGRAEIEASLKQTFASVKFLDMTHKQISLEVSGNLAVETGTVEQKFQESGKAPQKQAGRYVLVFKNVNGKWRVLRDIETPMPPGSPAT